MVVVVVEESHAMRFWSWRQTDLCGWTQYHDTGDIEVFSGIFVIYFCLCERDSMFQTEDSTHILVTTSSTNAGKQMTDGSKEESKEEKARIFMFGRTSLEPSGSVLKDEC